MSIEKTVTNLETLKINYLTDAMYEDALENNQINENELYMTPSSGGTSIPTADTVAEFDNDAHMNSEDMTSQEIEDFVDDLNVTGITLVDYIVEQGTSGIWTYRKWNSGVVECWYSNSFTVNFDTQAVGNLRTSSTTNSVAMPSVLTSVTEYNVSGYNTESTGWATLVTGATSGSDIILSYMGWTSSGNKTVVANIYIKGTWK